MTRRKGERPVSRPLDTWSVNHPVARSIATGSQWIDAWLGQKTIPLARLSKATGISAGRLLTIGRGDRLSRAELDALAIAWSISSGDLIASMPDPSLIVE